MKRIATTLTTVGVLAVGASSAQAAIVYEKGGKIYAASNSGKGSKPLATGRWPGITPNGQTVVYSDKSRTLFAVPVGGGTPVRLAGQDCSVCTVQFAPDSKAITLRNSKGDLSLIPLSAAPAVALGTKVPTFGTVSPDGTQVVFDSLSSASELFTIPITGGAAVKLPLNVGTAPVWTPAGIVATTVKPGAKPKIQLVLLDAAGTVKKILSSKAVPSAKALLNGEQIQIASQLAGTNVLTIELGKRHRGTLRLIDPASGKVKARRTLTDIETAENVSASGKTLLTVSRTGKLQSVSFKTGKRTTLIKSGVDSAFIN